MHLPHTASEGLACEPRVLQGGEHPCPRHAAGFGAFLSEWVRRHCLTPCWDLWAGSAAGGSRLGGRPCSRALLCLGASSAVARHEPGGRMKWDEGAAWSGILAFAHPRAHLQSFSRLSTLFQHTLSRYPRHLSSPYTDSQQSPKELASNCRRSGPHPKGWSLRNSPNCAE